MATPKIVHDNRLDDATPTSSGDAAGYSVLNLRDWRPFTYWKPSALPGTVTVDCGAPKAVDNWLIWGHTLHTNGNTIELHGSTDNFGVSDVTVDSATPTDDTPFLRLVASVSYRYWRLKVLNGTAPTIAIAALGAALSFPYQMDQGFDPTARTVVAQDNRSASGYPLGRVTYFEKYEQTLAWSMLAWSWIRGTFLPAWTSHLRDRPFVFAWDTDTYPADLKLVAIKDMLKTPTNNGPYSDMQFDVVGLSTV